MDYAIITNMTGAPQTDRFWIRASLIAAVSVPVIYFGTQFVAAPFFSGYSFTRMVASILGTSASRQPWIFNVGISLTGIMAILGSPGLYESLRVASGVRLSRITAFCLAYTGAICVKSGIFPLPDRRHSSPGASFTYMLPLLLFIAIWSASRSPALRGYLLLSMLLMLPVVLLLHGAIRIAGLEAGAIQRLLALATLVPVGVVGFFFLRREQRQRQSASRRLP